MQNNEQSQGEDLKVLFANKKPEGKIHVTNQVPILQRWKEILLCQGKNILQGRISAFGHKNTE